MSYTKQTWETGDVITADKLNHMEDGIADAGGGGALTIGCIITTSGNKTYYTLDKTWKEIHDAYVGGTPCVVSITSDEGEGTTGNYMYLVTNVTSITYDEYPEDNSYGVYAYYDFSCGSESGYPQYMMVN